MADERKYKAWTMSQSPLPYTYLLANTLPEVTSKGDFYSQAEHNLDISLGAAMCVPPQDHRFTAQKITIINPAYGVSRQSSCAYSRLGTYLYPPLHIHTFSLSRERIPEPAGGCACCVFTYFPLKTDRQWQWIEPQTDS